MALLPPGARGHDEGEGEGSRPQPSTPVLEGTSEAKEQTVVVHGTLPEASTASTTVVTAQEMGAVPQRTAEDALRLVPGVALVQHGSEGKGTQLFVRGFDAVHGADFEITLEGIPLNEWSNIHAQGYLDLGIVIPETVESIRVTKGPFRLDQGAFAMAGSADYHLGIPPADQGTRLAYTAGTTNRHRGLMTHSFEGSEGHDFVASETLYDEGLGQNRSVGRGVAMVRRTLWSSEHESLSLLSAGQVARFDLPTPLRNEDVDRGAVGFWDSYEDQTRGESVRGLSGISYVLESAGQKLRATVHGGYRQLELLENFTGFLRDPVNGDRRVQRQKSWTFGATSSYQAALSSSWAWNMGIGFRGELLQQSQDHVGRNEEHLASERDLAGFQTLSHGQAGLTFRPVDSLRIDAGVRADLAYLAAHDRRAESRGKGSLMALSPRSTAEWRVVPPLRLFASYGRGFRPPELRGFSGYEPESVGITDEVYDEGEPRMTLADAFEAGAQVRPHHTISASVSGFLTLIQAENVFDHVSATNLELNPTRRLGTELVVRLRPLSWFLVVADATYVDARFQDSLDLVPLAPRLLGGIRAVATPSNGWRAGLRFFGLAPRPLPHGATGGTWTQVDATVGRHFERWQIDLEVENLFGQRIRQGEFHFSSNWDPGAPGASLPALHYFAGPPRNARLALTMFL